MSALTGKRLSAIVVAPHLEPMALLILDVIEVAALGTDAGSATSSGVGYKQREACKAKLHPSASTAMIDESVRLDS